MTRHNVEPRPCDLSALLRELEHDRIELVVVGSAALLPLGFDVQPADLDIVPALDAPTSDSTGC